MCYDSIPRRIVKVTITFGLEAGWGDRKPCTF